MKNAMDNIVIRKMSNQDIPEVAAIERECFSMPWSEKSFEDSLALSYAHFYIAESGDRIAGYVGLYNVADEGDITNIAVLPQYRRKGIASRLISEVIRFSEELGIRAINLEVRESNKNAISLYTKNGFKNVGIRKNFYEKPVENAIIMVLERD